MSLLKCVECESSVSSEAVVCPNCGCPASETILKYKRKQQKTIATLLGVSLLVVAIVFIIVKVMPDSDKNGYYNGFSWGSSSKSVLAKLPDTSKLDDKKGIIVAHDDNFCGLTGVTAVPNYKFENDALTRVTVLVLNPENSSFTSNDIVETIIAHYDKQYGAYTVETLGKVWKAKKSEIRLTYLTEEVIYIIFTSND